MQLVYNVSEPTCSDCLLKVQLVYTVSKPTCRGLSAGGAVCLYGFQTYLQGTVGYRCSRLYGFQTYLQGTVCWRCSLFIRFPNFPAGDCLLEVQFVYTVSEPTCRGLSAVGAACLYVFQTYLHGTVGWSCSLFLWFPNLPPGDCWPWVLPVYTALEPTSRDLSSCGAACALSFRFCNI